MFIVLLEFSDNKSKASELMEGHKAWIKQGYDAGDFLVIGSLVASDIVNGGGCVLMKSDSLQDAQAQVQQDPFVQENVVTAKIIEIQPNQMNEHIQLALAG